MPGAAVVSATNLLRTRWSVGAWPGRADRDYANSGPGFSAGWQDALDCALMVWTVPALTPRGALFLDGVPLIIARRPPGQPLANTQARAGGVTVIA
jgi:hypothetical protein